jgi:hypothetical protein
MYQRPLIIVQRSVPITIGTLSSTFTINSLRFVTVNRWVVPTIGRTHKTMLIVTHLQYNDDRNSAFERCATRLAFVDLFVNHSKAGAFIVRKNGVAISISISTITITRTKRLLARQSSGRVNGRDARQVICLVCETSCSLSLPLPLSPSLLLFSAPYVEPRSDKALGESLGEWLLGKLLGR